MAKKPVFYFCDSDSYDGDSEFERSDAVSRDRTVLSSQESFGEKQFSPPQTSNDFIPRHRLLIQGQDSRRPKSATSFSPGPHRRSHPSLKHLSLAPLTPKYPIYPSDYDAYVDPDTSQLHTSSSLSHMASISGPGSILSDGTRRPVLQPHRKAKSSTSMAAQRPGYSSRSTRNSGKSTTADIAVNERLEKTRLLSNKPDPAWLFQTGIALTEGSRESKGQSWLAKRDSSTSLHSSSDDLPNFGSQNARQPAKTTPPQSRGTIKARKQSRRDLQMTPSRKLANLDQNGRNDAGISESEPSTKQEEDEYTKADWADPQTQAETAASLDSELAHELDGDSIGLIMAEDDDSEEGGATDEEKEIRTVAKSRGFRLGGLVDNVVDVFLGLDNAEEDDLEKQDQRNQERNMGVKMPEATSAVSEKDREEASERELSDDGMEPAPENPKSVWEDVRWLSRLAYRTATS